MSWDVMSEERATCGCGRGFVLIQQVADDWGRWEQRTELDCEFCKAQLAAEWERTRPTREAAARKRADIEKQLERMAVGLRKKYRTAWHARFQGKSKKLIWEELDSCGISLGALGTFYQRLRDRGLDAELEGRLQSEFLFRGVSLLLPLTPEERGRLDRLYRELDSVDSQAT